MKREKIIIITLSALLLLLSVALVWVAKEQRRVEENCRRLYVERQELMDSLVVSEASVARLRLTVGELEEFRARDAEEIRRMGLQLRRVKSLTRVETQVRLDTLLQHSDSTVVPMLSDSLLQLRLRDEWLSLDVLSRPTESHISLITHDTLFQVVHRIPHRWWIFSWGTKAIRQEISSSNPHTRLHYAEYIELE